MLQDTARQCLARSCSDAESVEKKKTPAASRFVVLSIALALALSLALTVAMALALAVTQCLPLALCSGFGSASCYGSGSGLASGFEYPLRKYPPPCIAKTG